MFVVVTENQSGETLLCRRMGPYEKMDADKFAAKIAADYETSIDQSDGYIPSGCGDIRVEFRFQRDNAFRIWNGQDYFFKQGEKTCSA